MQRPPEPGTPVAVPYVLADGEGEVIRWFGDTITVKSAGPTLDVSMVTAVAGSELPLHVHGEVDEALFVLGGSLTVVAGSERLAASAGAFIFLPARVPHALVVESGSATLLVIAVPSGSLTMYGEIEERFGHARCQPAYATPTSPSSRRRLKRTASRSSSRTALPAQ